MQEFTLPEGNEMIELDDEALVFVAGGDDSSANIDPNG
jgi:hypothetical protein